MGKRAKGARVPAGVRASIAHPVQHPVETFTEAERTRLAPHVTNLDRPVFALVNLPETVKGALFARYSRYQGTLRRLFLDEFAESAPQGHVWEGAEGRRAAELYERIFLGYGDDSVAQLGGAHVACEWVSNVLTKVLQRPRLAAYLEQSTRYIPYDTPMPGGGYRYYRDPELGPHYEHAMDAVFDAYARALPRVAAWVAAEFPGDDSPARRRAVQAKALDLLRGLLPAASLSHMGIYASGQTYEQLILHLLAHPLPEARRYGQLILEAVQAVMPSFVTRVERPDRGGEWIGYLEGRERAADRWVRRLGLDRQAESGGAPVGAPAARRRRRGRAAGRAALRGRGRGRGGDAHPSGRALGRRAHRAALGPRRRAGEPPPSPGPRLRGAALPLRDRLGLRRLPRPPAPPDADRPVAAADPAPGRRRARRGAGGRLRRPLPPRARRVTRPSGSGSSGEGREREALYALSLGYRIRYVLDLNAREAMQLIELRSGREGHPSYRAVAHEMHRLIAQVHPAVAGAMTHVDTEAEPRLERILSEMRTQAKIDALSGR